MAKETVIQQCPFWKYHTTQGIRCEGFTETQTTGLTFGLAADCLSWHHDYCCNTYWACPIFGLIAQHQYPDDAQLLLAGCQADCTSSMPTSYAKALGLIVSSRRKAEQNTD